MMFTLQNSMNEIASLAIPMPIAGIGSAVLGWLMFMLSIFLILLVLVQRGKGGGLAGALGGPGGQSAFGSKAGDTFTLITAVSAIIWGLICAIAMYSLGVPPATASDDEFSSGDDTEVTSPAGANDGAGGLGGLQDLGSSLSPALTDTTDPADTENDATEGEKTASDADANESAESPAGQTETPSAELTPKDPPASEATSDGDEPTGADQ